jgi:hypothetical protein
LNSNNKILSDRVAGDAFTVPLEECDFFLLKPSFPTPYDSLSASSTDRRTAHHRFAPSPPVVAVADTVLDAGRHTRTRRPSVALLDALEGRD